LIHPDREGSLPTITNESSSKDRAGMAAIPTPAQVRAARAILGWSQDEVCRRIGMSRRTLTSIENEERQPRFSSMVRLAALFDAAGVEFVFFRGGRQGVIAKITEFEFVD